MFHLEALRNKYLEAMQITSDKWRSHPFGVDKGAAAIRNEYEMIKIK